MMAERDHPSLVGMCKALDFIPSKTKEKDKVQSQVKVTSTVGVGRGVLG